MTETIPERPRDSVLGPYRGLTFGLSFQWLIAGALLYALLLLVAIKGNPLDVISPFLGPSVYLTPMFGLPLVLRTIHRPGRMRRLIYFMIVLPAVHMAAIYMAFYHLMSTYNPIEAGGTFLSAVTSGALGGVAGAVFGFTGLYLVRLAPRRRAELFTMSSFTLVLVLAGAAGLGHAVVIAGVDLIAASHDAERLILGFEIVHLPWQIVFAAALAWLMRPPHAKKVSPSPAA